MRNEDKPCDIDMIKKFSVHDYKCYQFYWEKNYAEGGKFHTTLASRLEELLPGERDWYDYIVSRPLWVTETNCNWDNDRVKGHKDDPRPTALESCQRITGQTGGDWGIGSIKTMIGMDNIERVSWWNASNSLSKYREMTKVARLVSWEGEVLPPGRAFLSDFRTCN